MNINGKTDPSMNFIYSELENLKKEIKKLKKEIEELKQRANAGRDYGKPI